MSTGTQTEVVMPQMGVSVSEGTITKWLRQAGESIGRDEPLLEISTDKVDTEVPSPAEGVVAQILVPEGETVARRNRARADRAGRNRRLGDRGSACRAGSLPQRASGRRSSGRSCRGCGRACSAAPA